jgi:iron complex outermembrane receptor protein
MDNLTLGYTFGSLPILGGRIRDVQGARIFGTIQNVFTSTKYTGIDPTSGVNGIDNNIYPRSRTFLGGVSFGF